MAASTSLSGCLGRWAMSCLMIRVVVNKCQRNARLHDHIATYSGKSKGGATTLSRRNVWGRRDTGSGAHFPSPGGEGPAKPGVRRAMWTVQERDCSVSRPVAFPPSSALRAPSPLEKEGLSRRGVQGRRRAEAPPHKGGGKRCSQAPICRHKVPPPPNSSSS